MRIYLWEAFRTLTENAFSRLPHLESAAPKIIKKLESYEATLTETVTFTTKVSGTPKPTVEWLKDGKTVVIDGKKYIAAEEEAAVFSLTVTIFPPEVNGSLSTRNSVKRARFVYTRLTAAVPMTSEPTQLWSRTNLARRKTAPS